MSGYLKCVAPEERFSSFTFVLQFYISSLYLQNNSHCIPSSAHNWVYQWTFISFSFLFFCLLSRLMHSYFPLAFRRMNLLLPGSDAKNTWFTMAILVLASPGRTTSPTRKFSPGTATSSPPARKFQPGMDKLALQPEKANRMKETWKISWARISASAILQATLPFLTTRAEPRPLLQPRRKLLPCHAKYLMEAYKIAQTKANAGTQYN